MFKKIISLLMCLVLLATGTSSIFFASDLDNALSVLDTSQVGLLNNSSATINNESLETLENVENPYDMSNNCNKNYNLISEGLEPGSNKVNQKHQKKKTEHKLKAPNGFVLYCNNADYSNKLDRISSNISDLGQDLSEYYAYIGYKIGLLANRIKKNDIVMYLNLSISFITLIAVMSAVHQISKNIKIK